MCQNETNNRSKLVLKGIKKENKKPNHACSQLRAGLLAVASYDHMLAVAS